METRHVFLDTDAFRQLGHNPDAAPLVELGKKIAEGQLILHMTDITLAEIRRQLSEHIAEAAREGKAARKSVFKWRQRHPALVADIQDIDVAAVSAAAFEKFRHAVEEKWNATWHDATSISSLSIFEDYFAGRPPFSQPKSKEFPDAFVIKALDEWCQERGERLYVVSRDKAMQQAVEASPRLISAINLKDILAAATKVWTPDIVRRAGGLLTKKSVINDLQNAIELEIDDLIPVYGGDFSEGEVTGHSMSGDIRIASYGVIAATSEELSVIMDVYVPLTIELSYEDRSGAVYENEDDTYYGGETAETEFQDDPAVRIFARLRQQAPHVQAVEILTGEVRVHEPAENYK
ncbi:MULTISPECIES: PIN domain-containing protein [Agrobacterium]|uniref:PIN domain-containing protein n=1 Tax=Agrobacterium tumefaciens TaxID=358 RepID=UPI001572C0DD|nr:DUF4935 domain-containing protein [Agrobacterium tumefaciens]NSZ06332.1 DUF4935 domain-containing protein [Agrobacterium tumefaciens]